MPLIPVSLMQSEESIERCAYNLCRELWQQGTIYAEIRFAPQKHCDRGLTQEQAVRAAMRGVRKSDLDAQLILCCMRDGRDNRQENLETVELTHKYRNQGVCACDLAGAEALFANDRYGYIFERAGELGVPYTIHSGEALGADSVAMALDFGAKRIGHGIRSVEDEAVVRRLARCKVPIEVCPTSNINTCVYGAIADMPIMDLVRRGVAVTINSDNMSVSNTSVRKELERVSASFGLREEDIRAFLLNSADAAFVGEGKKQELRDKINLTLPRFSL